MVKIKKKKIESFKTQKTKKRKNNKNPTKKGKWVRQPQKKKSGLDLKCYERNERHEIWIDVRRVNLTWQVWEKTKKNLFVTEYNPYFVIQNLCKTQSIRR